MGRLSLSSWRATHLCVPGVVTVSPKHSPQSPDLGIGHTHSEKASHSEHIENVADIYLQPPAGLVNERVSSKGIVQEDDPTEPWSFQPKRLPDESLPFILATVVKERDGQENESGRQSRLWIVVNGVVLDVTEYQFGHPGGRAIISGFGGQDCTWQWFSFHGMDIWRSVAAGLRVGRTEGVMNPFRRPKGIVGLQGHGFQDWD
ncbi:hypothetical protein LTR78_008244 [Recurvomyces mirabilis]|uniref:Cytochrome b5 heme-binding domain-containing protein n=1 Tax=Recurvomyces mirabilis TaxID=574656 RepID=A0AAE0WFT4_9PEZI|nr:hypothetical protein LTR78_008244 [Recurvomyces mirabilis]KAK5156529.1 hypothetical protein LTS14_004741 [Recurvomyces mirabilis]